MFLIDVVKKGEMFKWKGTAKKFKEELKRTRDHDKKMEVKECPQCRRSDLLELCEAERMAIGQQGDDKIIGCSECDYWEFKD